MIAAMPATRMKEHESEPEGAADQQRRLVPDNWLPSDVRVYGPQLVHEARLTPVVKRVMPRVDLEEEPAAPADELSPHLFGQIAERERRRPRGDLKQPPLLGEIGRQPRLVVGEGNFDGTSFAPFEPLDERRRHPGNDEEFLRRPLTTPGALATSMRRFKVSSATVSARRSRGRGTSTRILSAIRARRSSRASFSAC